MTWGCLAAVLVAAEAVIVDYTIALPMALRASTASSVRGRCCGSSAKATFHEEAGFAYCL